MTGCRQLTVAWGTRVARNGRRHSTSGIWEHGQVQPTRRGDWTALLPVGCVEIRGRLADVLDGRLLIHLEDGLFLAVLPGVDGGRVDG